MTLVIALVWGQGILVSADSRASASSSQCLGHGSWALALRKAGTPSPGRLRRVSSIESRLMVRYRELREVGIEPNVNLLLATVTQEGKPLLYVFDDRGLAQPMHDNPGYTLLGKGMITGALLLLRLLDYRPEEAWEWD